MVHQPGPGLGPASAAAQRQLEGSAPLSSAEPGAAAQLTLEARLSPAQLTLEAQPWPAWRLLASRS